MDDETREQLESILNKLGGTTKITADGNFKWSIQTHDWELLDDSSLEGMKAKLAQLEEQYEVLEDAEPEDEEAHDRWCEQLENLEDHISELEDLISNME